MDQTCAEAAILSRINAIRKNHGLGELQPSAALAAVARAHSEDMAAHSYFEHTSPAGVTLADRVLAAGLRYHMVGENVFQAWGHGDPVAEAAEGWMKSPGHRANILRGEFVETGIGVARVGDRWYVTQDFLRP